MDIDRNYILSFGKYKGKKLIEVLYEDPNYLLWLDKNVDEINLSDALYFRAKDLAEQDEIEDLYDPEVYQDIF